jgi:hypothetical protein
MLGVIIHWDHKPTLLDEGKRNLFQHYDYVCRAFGVDQLVIVDVDGTMTLSPPHTVVRTLEEAVDKFPAETKFCTIHSTGAWLLEDYVHPKDAVYVTGPDFGGFDFDSYFDGDFDSVAIPMKDPEMALWADQALAVVLATRG